MPEPSRWIFRNASRRPVELHLSSGVRVLSAEEKIEVSGLEPHCRVLEKQGVLTRHRPAPAKPEERTRKGPSKPADEAAAKSSSKKKRPRAKSAKGTTGKSGKKGGKKGTKKSRKSKSQSGKKETT